MAHEFALIERLLGQVSMANSLTPAPLLGPGDDCALVAPPSPGLVWAISTDMLVEGTHFLATDPPEDLGWKTLAVNVSDLAAMGATPRYATLAVALSLNDDRSHWVDRFFAGFAECAQRHDVRLIGGDTTRGPRNFCVTVMGEVAPDKALRRSGARDGDDLWVSGTPGMAALGLMHKLGQTVLPDTLIEPTLTALHRPTPRVALGIALTNLAHSCLDVSDGLLQDLGHITHASRLSATLFADALPHPPTGVDKHLWQQCLLGGGDDYELLFSAPVSARRPLLELSTSLDLPLHRFGQLHATPSDTAHSGTVAAAHSPNIQLLDANRHPIDLENFRPGFDHFA